MKCPLRFKEFTTEPSMQKCIGEDCAWYEPCRKDSTMEPIISHGIAALCGLVAGMLLMALMAVSGKDDHR